MLGDILLGIPWGFLLAFTIGPVFFVLLETAITKGFRSALVFNVGVVLSDVTFITIAYFGTSSFKDVIQHNAFTFLLSGGILLFLYGVYAYVKQIKSKCFQVNVFEKEIREISTNYFGLFAKGFLLNFINVGVLVFWFGILITFLPRFNMDKARLFHFLLSIILMYFSIDCIKILIAKRLGNFLTPKHIYQIRKLVSIVIMLFGLALIIHSFCRDMNFDF